MIKTIIETADIGRYKIFVNEEKRTVVVLLETYGDNVGDIISKEVIKNSNDTISLLPEFCDCYIDTCFRGIAKCHPEDKFDEAKGITIAKSRARIKYLDAKRENLYKSAISLSNAALAIGKRCEKIEKTIQKLCVDAYSAGI